MKRKGWTWSAYGASIFVGCLSFQMSGYRMPLLDQRMIVFGLFGSDRIGWIGVGVAYVGVPHHGSIPAQASAQVHSKSGGELLR